jgi:hypothetical protein
MNNLSMETLNKLWKEFAEVTIDAEGFIEEQFQHWPAGTEREQVWNWFEESNPEFSVAEKMYAKPEQKAEGEDERNQLLEICEATAAAIFTSIDTEDFYNDSYVPLRDRAVEDEYPDEVYPWEVFNHKLPEELLEYIDTEADLLYQVFQKTLATIETQLKDKGVNLKGLKLKDLAVRETLIY